MRRFMDARVKPGHDVVRLSRNADAECAAMAGMKRIYFRTQITRVTEAFAASTPAVSDDGAT